MQNAPKYQQINAIFAHKLANKNKDKLIIYYGTVSAIH